MHPDARTALARAMRRGAERSTGSRTGGRSCSLPSRPSPLTGAAVLLGEQVVGERWRIGQALHRGVEEAGVPEVLQPGTDPVDPLPLHGEALHGEEHLLGRGDPVAQAPRGMVAACGERGCERRGCGARGGPPSPSLPTLLAGWCLFGAAVAAGCLGAGVEQHVLAPQQFQLPGEAAAGGLELDLLQQHLLGRGGQQPAQLPVLARLPPARLQRLLQLLHDRHGGARRPRLRGEGGRLSGGAGPFCSRCGATRCRGNRPRPSPAAGPGPALPAGPRPAAGPPPAAATGTAPPARPPPPATLSAAAAATCGLPGTGAPPRPPHGRHRGRGRGGEGGAGACAPSRPVPPGAVPPARTHHPGPRRRTHVSPPERGDAATANSFRAWSSGGAGPVPAPPFAADTLALLHHAPRPATD